MRVFDRQSNLPEPNPEGDNSPSVRGTDVIDIQTKCRAFSPEFMALGRESEPEVERDWIDPLVDPAKNTPAKSLEPSLAEERSQS